VAGLQVVASRRAVVAVVVLLLVVVAGSLDYQQGPAPWSEKVYLPAEAGPLNDAGRQALGLIDPGAPVSAQENLVAHRAHRTSVYEFSNPFIASATWGFPGDQHQPLKAEGIRYIAVERRRLGERDRALLDRLRAQTQWRTVLDREGVVVLERRR
jgi:hypothetical protein